MYDLRHNVLEWCINSKTDSSTNDTLASTSVSVVLNKVEVTIDWFRLVY